MLYYTLEHSLLNNTITLIFIKFVNCSFNYMNFGSIAASCFNDSIVLLYTLASPINTLQVLFFLLFYVLLKLNRKTTLLNYVTFYCVFFYFTKSYFFLTFVSRIIVTSPINTMLQNGFLNIHPPIVYFMYAIVTISYIYIYVCTNAKKTQSLAFYLYSWVLLCLFGIILGAYWAAQELNWGGFWSWDPVEIVSLLLFFYACCVFHSSSIFFTTLKNFISFTIVVIIIYGVIRLGLITTIHSFIRNSNSGLHIIMIFITYFIYVVFYKNACRMKISKKTPISFNIIIYNTIYKNVLYNILYVGLLVICYILFYMILQPVYKEIIPLNISTKQIFYYVLTYTSLVCVYTYINNQSIKPTQVLILGLFTCFCVTLKIHMLYFMVILMYAGFTRNKALHSLLLFSYVIFYLGFVNYTIYTTKYNITLTQVTGNLIYQIKTSCTFYENAFFLKKSVFLYKYKSIWIHTTGFNLLSTIFSTMFCFCKNLQHRVLFVEETLLIYFVLISFFYMYYLNLCTLLKYQISKY